jgi:hypothetical protein
MAAHVSQKSIPVVLLVHVPCVGLVDEAPAIEAVQLGHGPAAMDTNPAAYAFRRRLLVSVLSNAIVKHGSIQEEGGVGA